MIRLANMNDLPVIVKFNIAMAEETEHLQLNQSIIQQGVKSLLEDPTKGCYYVYEWDGQVVGQLMITKEWSDWRNADFWWIQSVYVTPHYRRNGVFKSLFEHIQNIVKQDESICGLRLYVDKLNLQAQATYSSLGMKPSHYLFYEWKK